MAADICRHLQASSIDPSTMRIDDIVPIEEKKPAATLGRQPPRLGKSARSLYGDVVAVGIVRRETHIAYGFVCARRLRADLESRTDDIGQRNSRRAQILVESVDLFFHPHH